LKTYIINLSNGHELSLHGDAAFEILEQNGTVSFRSGRDTYFFFREAVLYWTVSEDGLTERQTQIVRLMGEGKTNAAIARSLGYSESTIRQESMGIYRSLGVNNREEAVAAHGALEDLDRVTLLAD
jgi:DNA-binding NarL/FixJ family response regulator